MTVVLNKLKQIGSFAEKSATSNLGRFKVSFQKHTVLLLMSFQRETQLNIVVRLREQ